MFTKPLRVEQIDQDMWRLTDDLEFVHNGYPRVRYVVPAGFITDFASVPWVFRVAVPTYGRYTRSAVLHDYLLSIYDRKHCDNILMIAMRTEDVRIWRRASIYVAVRAFSLYVAIRGAAVGIFR